MKSGKIHIDKLVDNIMSAKSPEEIFGKDVGQIKKKYRVFRGMTHPDKHSTEHEEIRKFMLEGFQKLKELWDESEKRVEKGIYGTKEVTEKSTIRIKNTDYTIIGSYPGGSICDVYKCEGDIVLKKVRSKKDNDLIENEISILKFLEKHKDPYYSQYLPMLIAEYKLRITKEKVLTMPDYGDEFISLVELRDQYNSIDPRHIVWIFKRLLTVLGFVHNLGVTHGAVLPEHALIRKRDHALILIDWSYAVKGSDRVKAIDPNRKGFYPNEIINKDLTGGYTDIHMAAQTAMWLQGNGKLPDAMHRFFASCSITNKAYRPTDAWELIEDLNDVSYGLYGKPKFIELK